MFLFECLYINKFKTKNIVKVKQFSKKNIVYKSPPILKNKEKEKEKEEEEKINFVFLQL